MQNMDMMRLKVAPLSQIEEMAKMIVAQNRRLHELEAKLQKEKQEKANLEVDFQHLLDQVGMLASVQCMREDAAIVCG